MTSGKVTRPYLGVGIFDKETAGRYAIFSMWTRVSILKALLLMARLQGRLRRGDIILSIGDKETNKVSDVRNTILDSKVGDSVKVKYERNGNVSLWM